ncbi:hypothetical protein [Luteibacter sp. 3190]|uniref:hypothetical protein n=1 Tax=Luteibacter sp. 3190 TaxID=2817736 RepID=UPI002855FBE3|nr:hypothetical protein [Luteibacter sp. 3190]MDR6935339.1 tRNA(Ile)-lysidine synthase TilS/MesJ [Luteibacter sp. 3190]
MSIFVITPHGRFEVTNWKAENTILEVCQLNRIPANAISLYIEQAGSRRLVTNLLSTVDELVPPDANLTIRPDRNIDYHEIIPETIITDVGADDVSEYFFSNNNRSYLLSGLTSEECRDYVNASVNAVIDAHGSDIRAAHVVVGISGGGDSNALLGALVAAGVKNIYPVMMMGIPDWDRGKHRAEAICAAHNIPLRVVESGDVGRLLGVAEGRNWVQAFEETYPDVDFEMLGTLAVRLVLAAVAKEQGATTVITGTNLEDLLGEALMCILEGQPPLPYPRRKIGDIDIFYPLYTCPKKIIDGCFPKYSLENYEDRFPSRLRGRALAYYLAQSMNALIPGIEFDLLEGLRKLSRNWDSSHFDSDLGFTVLRSISKESKDRWNAFLGV